ncbi:rCG53411 [Rattus norvegicus]|uniref:RCG53411 n=1 Tax=Rattus norvegicus TaxID=10116 RepID=A6JRI2_RAT|nr:rCG53411 [Rattus norvegicus]
MSPDNAPHSSLLKAAKAQIEVFMSQEFRCSLTDASVSGLFKSAGQVVFGGCEHHKVWLRNESCSRMVN